MSTINLNELRDRAYKIARDHGFHDADWSNEHLLCLVISEQLEDSMRTWNGFTEPANLYCERTWSNFPTQSPVCRGNDGLPFDVVCLTISLTAWCTGSIKGYGNAIVPQVMYEIFKAIETIQD
jgi:hypothetical protein